MKAYSIKEAADLFGITTNKLRFYEKKNLLIPRRQEENNYRYYTEEDLIRLQTILMYRVLNLSIDDIRHILNNNYKDNMLDHVYKQWSAINDEVHRLTSIRGSLEKIMDTVYDHGEGQYETKIIEIIKDLNTLHELKESWKDRWDFDGWAEVYDQFVQEDPSDLELYENYNSILHSVYDRARPYLRGEASVLEIGVGTGNLASKFLEARHDIVGIDQSREMLNVAKRKYPNLKLRLGEFLKIPFESHRFDVLVSTYAFHHLNEDEKKVALKEMLRVLKDDGIIIIGDLMFENEASKKSIMASLSKKQTREIEDEYYTDIEKLEEDIKAMGKDLTIAKMNKLFYILEIK